VKSRTLMRILLGAAVGLTALWPSVACEDLNQMFTGLWRASAASPGGPVEGAPELAIGHFGREVAGVAYFKIVAGGSEFVSACPCAFIEHQQLDLGRRTVRFATQCDGGPRLDWRLELSIEGARRFLDGEVTRADGGPGSAQFRLERAEEFVRDAEKQCPVVAP
jgi:hypothetical protein